MKRTPIASCSAWMFLLGALALLAGWSTLAADAPAKVPEDSASCVSCHGAAGKQPVTPETPRLAGQKYDYLVHALEQYRSGARPNPIMGAMAKSLTDAQIQRHARYFSAQDGLTTKY